MAVRLRLIVVVVVIGGGNGLLDDAGGYGLNTSLVGFDRRFLGSYGGGALAISHLNLRL